MTRKLSYLDIIFVRFCQFDYTLDGLSLVRSYHCMDLSVVSSCLGRSYRRMVLSIVRSSIGRSRAIVRTVLDVPVTDPFFNKKNRAQRYFYIFRNTPFGLAINKQTIITYDSTSNDTSNAENCTRISLKTKKLQQKMFTLDIERLQKTKI